MAEVRTLRQRPCLPGSSPPANSKSVSCSSRGASVASEATIPGAPWHHWVRTSCDFPSRGSSDIGHWASPSDRFAYLEAAARARRSSSARRAGSRRFPLASAQRFPQNHVRARQCAHGFRWGRPAKGRHATQPRAGPQIVPRFTPDVRARPLVHKLGCDHRSRRTPHQLPRGVRGIGPNSSSSRSSCQAAGASVCATRSIPASPIRKDGTGPRQAPRSQGETDSPPPGSRPPEPSRGEVERHRHVRLVKRPDHARRTKIGRPAAEAARPFRRVGAPATTGASSNTVSVSATMAAGIAARTRARPNDARSTAHDWEDRRASGEEGTVMVSAGRGTPAMPWTAPALRECRSTLRRLCRTTMIAARRSRRLSGQPNKGG